jgi:hypothetical protein
MSQLQFQARKLDNNNARELDCREKIRIFSDALSSRKSRLSHFFKGGQVNSEKYSGAFAENIPAMGYA